MRDLWRLTGRWACIVTASAWLMLLAMGGDPWTFSKWMVAKIVIISAMIAFVLVTWVWAEDG